MIIMTKDKLGTKYRTIQQKKMQPAVYVRAWTKLASFTSKIATFVNTKFTILLEINN
jgi:hypothetical protein